MQPLQTMPESNIDLYNYYLAGGNNTFSDVDSYGFPASYHDDFPPDQSLSCNNNSSFFEMSNIITQSTPEARAVAASQHHKEAERRRRERINSHLDRLRTLLPCNSKTDKASLLAKVVQRVKELKEETSEIMQLEKNIPSETDEITVLSNDTNSADGKLLIKASLCCDDRSDLISELNEVLKSLQLSPIRAEMVTMGGRIRNVIILAGNNKDHIDESIPFLRDALRSLIQRSNYGSGDRPKRRRVFHHGIVS